MNSVFIFCRNRGYRPTQPITSPNKWGSTLDGEYWSLKIKLYQNHWNSYIHFMPIALLVSWDKWISSCVPETYVLFKIELLPNRSFSWVVHTCLIVDISYAFTLCGYQKVPKLQQLLEHYKREWCGTGSCWKWCCQVFKWKRYFDDQIQHSCIVKSVFHMMNSLFGPV